MNMKIAGVKNNLLKHATGLAILTFSFVFTFGLQCSPSKAQEAAGPLKTPAKTPAQTPSTSDKVGDPSTADARALDQEQRILADRFSKLEELFIRMSELEVASNPTRASLLQQAAQLSKQLSTLQRLQSAADLLAKGQYSQAIKEQESTKDSMTKLLELLQSENRQSRIRDERERIEALIKDIQRIERLQRSLRGRTEGGQDKDTAQRDQEDIRKQAEETEKGLTPDNESESDKSNPKEAPENLTDKPSDKPSDSEPEKSVDPKPQESPEANKTENSSEPKPVMPNEKTEDTPPPDSSPKDSQSDNRKNAPPSPPNLDKPGNESSPPESTDSPEEAQSQESDSEKSPPQKPLTREETARKRLKQAQQKMQKAKDNLQKEERDLATKRQQDAEEELRLAAEELERILRQLREEEVERTLADLESRLKRMLQLQTRVTDQAKVTRDTPRSGEDRTFEIQCSKLAIEERKIQMEGQKALLLLQDEGSSLAFPEAVEQVNRDIALVTDYFSESKLDDSCMSLQAEIISALEEMVESLTATQRKMEEKKKKDANKNQQGGQQGEDEEQPLVDKLAELRLIKTLQLRINTRTDRLANESGKADDAKGDVQNEAILKQLQDLSERQEKIKQVTRDIVLEQTKK